MHFFAVETAAGPMHVNASHVIRVMQSNMGCRLVMSDGYSAALVTPIERVLVDLYYPPDDNVSRITLADINTLDDETA